MIKLDMPIIVEGRYDKIKLSNIFDTLIITTDGFGIFKNKEKARLIKKLADNKGVIVLTDSDSAGSIIRSHLKNIIGEDKIFTVILPPIKGKEKRKTTPSGEGILGVEGTEDKIIIDAFKRFLPKCFGKADFSEEITTAFLMEQGLSGTDDCGARRQFLLKKLGLPNAVAPKTLRKVLGEISSKAEIAAIMKEYK